MTIAPMLLGAVLVMAGVLSGALADRIRGNRTARREGSRAPAAKPSIVTAAHDRMACDVIAALVQSGYTKAEAVAATRMCAGSEQSTIESWTRAALRRMASPS